ncbi:MAG: hypothetical protein QXD11_01890 [Candidatus Micrarchaeaceae archaeon]
MIKETLPEIYKKLLSAFGFQNWWPADTSFEVVVGAVLTQQTSWKNVEHAISCLKEANLLDLYSISHSSSKKIESCVYSCGYYRQKTKTLKELCTYIEKNYKNMEEFTNANDKILRNQLLAIHGIGNETADSILLYACNKPYFVIDAYTKRLINRVFGIEIFDYAFLQKLFSDAFKKDVAIYKDVHAQIIALNKIYCKKINPLCDFCPIKSICRYTFM